MFLLLEDFPSNTSTFIFQKKPGKPWPLTFYRVEKTLDLTVGKPTRHGPRGGGPVPPGRQRRRRARGARRAGRDAAVGGGAQRARAGHAAVAAAPGGEGPGRDLCLAVVEMLPEGVLVIAAAVVSRSGWCGFGVCILLIRLIRLIPIWGWVKAYHYILLLYLGNNHSLTNYFDPHPWEPTQKNIQRPIWRRASQVECGQQKSWWVYIQYIMAW